MNYDSEEQVIIMKVDEVDNVEYAKHHGFSFAGKRWYFAGDTCNGDLIFALENEV